ncbi:MAG: WYL domain-containing protein [Thiomicrospira sp.]|jgi:hypothetical protein|nr:WYL domain-containing protein [Thiomicrospira sp.]
MLNTALSVFTTFFSFAAAFFWLLMFRHSALKYLASVWAVAGLLHWLPEVSQVFSIALFIASLAVVTYVNQHDGLSGYINELKASRESVILGRYKFSYRDAGGSDSQRKVDVHQMWSENGHTYFKGFCHRAKAERTFRLDRVFGEVIDLDTGEVIDI